MNLNYKRIFWLIPIISIGLSACAYPNIAKTTAATSDELGKISAWIAYWDDKNTVSAVSTLQNNLQSLHYFGVYFDDKSAPVIPQKLERVQSELEQKFGHSPPWENYITFVNDKLLPDGSFLLKDTALLYDLLETQESRTKHISEIISIARDHNFDGIEIDYEAIRKDTVLWQHFIDFATLLSQEATSNGFKLRIVLEPGIPYDTLQFPEGPDYAIMCYNLYGYNEIPGPKADDEFLRSLTSKTQSLPGKRIFALATDGYHWQGSSVSAISQRDAEALAQQTGVSVTRDPNSHSLTFTFEQDGVTHVVWYADFQTLKHWKDVIWESGTFDIAVWRLGGTDRWR